MERATDPPPTRCLEAEFPGVKVSTISRGEFRTNILTPCPGWTNYDADIITQTTEINMSTTGNASKNVLNSDVAIKGNIKFSGELTFDGKLDGEIPTDGTLTLGDDADVNGNINAASVVAQRHA